MVSYNRTFSIIVLALTGAAFTALAHAQSESEHAPPSRHLHCKKRSKCIDPPLDANSSTVGTISTRYGQVQYDGMGAKLQVDGKIVWEPTSDLIDGLDDRGYFKLPGEDVILFENVATTRRDNVPGEVFFLILKPNQAPLVVGTPLDPMTSDTIKKVWQEQDAVYIDFEGDEQFVSPIKLVSDEIVLTPKRLPKAAYGKNGPALQPGSCDGLYNMAKNDCSTKFTQRHEDCAMSANAATGIGISPDNKRAFSFLRQLPGFNEAKFNERCLAWCNGKDVWYDDFSKAVCNIK